MLTPLQRIGARALQRDCPRLTPPQPGASAYRKDSRNFTPSQPVNPASVPLPKVDLAEVEALNTSAGSEEQIIPESDGENDAEEPDSAEETSSSLTRRLDLSQFLYG